MKHNYIDAKNLIEGLIKIKPSDRLSIPEILAHPWIRSGELEDNVHLGKEECANSMQEKSAQPDINNVNVENLFPDSKENIKISYTDYCSITNDFYTQHLGTRQYNNI